MSKYIWNTVQQLQADGYPIDIYKLSSVYQEMLDSPMKGSPAKEESNNASFHNKRIKNANNSIVQPQHIKGMPKNQIGLQKSNVKTVKLK